MKCPFCKQDFSDNTAEFHIPWCKEQKAANKKAANTGENKDPDGSQKNKKNSGENVNAVGTGENINAEAAADPENGAQSNGENTITPGDPETK